MWWKMEEGPTYSPRKETNSLKGRIEMASAFVNIQLESPFWVPMYSLRWQLRHAAGQIKKNKLPFYQPVPGGIRSHEPQRRKQRHCHPCGMMVGGTCLITFIGSWQFVNQLNTNSIVAKRCFWGQRSLVPLLLLGPPFYPNILFGSTTLLIRMTSNYLHMQWPLTSQLHGSVSQIEQLVFCYGSNSMPFSD
jgi:hypothetical protein